jgi:hypothetical protein
MPHWYVFGEIARLKKAQLMDVDRRVCPTQCGGVLQRLAERQGIKPWHWIPIGWRCSLCGFACIDMEIDVCLTANTK